MSLSESQSSSNDLVDSAAQDEDLRIGDEDDHISSLSTLQEEAENSDRLSLNPSERVFLQLGTNTSIQFYQNTG